MPVMRFGWCAGLAIWAALLSGGADGAGQKPAEASLNPANERLTKLAPNERIAELARAVGHWCIGTEAVLMGVAADGAGKGNAYWSLRCADGSAWAIQIDPLGDFTAIGCDTYKEAGGGKECFKTF